MASCGRRSRSRSTFAGGPRAQLLDVAGEASDEIEVARREGFQAHILQQHRAAVEADQGVVTPVARDGAGDQRLEVSDAEAGIDLDLDHVLADGEILDHVAATGEDEGVASGAAVEVVVPGAPSTARGARA